MQGKPFEFLQPAQRCGYAAFQQILSPLLHQAMRTAWGFHVPSLTDLLKFRILALEGGDLGVSQNKGTQHKPEYTIVHIMMAIPPKVLAKARVARIWLLSPLDQGLPSWSFGIKVYSKT